MCARTSTPSIAELRAVTQPASIFERHSGEHWAGRLYMRRASPHVTRVLLRARATPNAVTWLMIAAGLLAALALSVPGIATAAAAVVLIQLQLLFDCCDGEVARWQRRSSTVGIYLDRLGHYLTESALPIALGVRADGGWGSPSGWVTVGLVVAVLVLLLKGEGALVFVARAESGRGLVEDREDVVAPRSRGLRRIRRGLARLPFYRAFVAMEATVLALAAAIVDATAGGHVGSRVLVCALVPVAALTVAGRLVAVLTSERLR
jgi:phosphatidylglycerophosphate synthase